MADQLTSTHAQPLIEERRPVGSAVDTPYWHPFANMAKVRGNELVINAQTMARIHDTAGPAGTRTVISAWP